MFSSTAITSGDIENKLGSTLSLSLHKCAIASKGYLRLIVQANSYLPRYQFDNPFQLSLIDTKASRRTVFQRCCSDGAYITPCDANFSNLTHVQTPFDPIERISSTVRWCKDRNHRWLRRHGVSRPNSKYRIEYRLAQCSVKWQ